MTYAKAYSHPEPYTYADPCAESDLDVAEAIVFGYTDEEVTERVTAWFKAESAKFDVYEAWWTEVVQTMSDEEMDATFDRIWANGSIAKLVLPQLLKRDGDLWDAFAKFFSAIEARALEVCDD